MAKYKVLLHGRDVVMAAEDDAEPQRAGFYVNCCVDAPDAETAGNVALEELRQHSKYRDLKAWPGTGGEGSPHVQVDSVDRVPFWRRHPALGITTGYIFYVDPDEPPVAQEEGREGSDAARRRTRG